MVNQKTFKDLTGKRFGKLLVISYYGKKINKKGKYIGSLWNCKCDCGNIKIINGSALKSLKTKSCGCNRAIKLTKTGILIGNKIKGEKRKSYPKIYSSWAKIKQRCLNKNNPRYHRYGGRGITVCERWLKFENFRDDMEESCLKHIKEFGNKDTSMFGDERNGIIRIIITVGCLYPATIY